MRLLFLNGVIRPAWVRLRFKIPREVPRLSNVLNDVINSLEQKNNSIMNGKRIVVLQ